LETATQLLSALAVAAVLLTARLLRLAVYPAIFRTYPQRFSVQMAVALVAMEVALSEPVEPVE
jgi:hypothetical protein